ncbi:MAG: zinc ribbon domain-containing protein [Chloroflexi bacterium]|nr:zinc ribbon domain-containing protein [Chloroflexota bacterium]
MTEPKKELRHCPYCDDEMVESDLPYCQLCGVSVFYCPGCHKPVPRDNRVCPHCGAEIKGESA